MTRCSGFVETRTNIDPVWALERAFHDMFRSVFQYQGVRLHFGFSQISFFHNREGLPAWYLWFGEKKGAYKIALTSAALISPGSDDHSTLSASLPHIQGSLAIHYYPSEEEDTFDSYSYFEKLIRLSSLFDHTGTPSFQRDPDIPVSHFVVGRIDVRTTPCLDFLELECVAPERWLDFRVDGLNLMAPDQQNHEVLGPGEKDRDVPGWALSWFLFNKITSGFCYHHRASPSEVLLIQDKGFKFHIDKDGRMRMSEDCTFSEFRLLARLAASRDRGDTRHTGYSAMRASNRQNLKMGDLVGTWRHPEAGMPPWVNAAWWSAKEVTFGEDAIPHCCQGHLPGDQTVRDSSQGLARLATHAR